ncbi:hypothetical protein EJV47_05845 [Hymenobacter gummosus]|uniref:Uncharacterized protein n=1 Tax=Hymenobacter gummosus TaxID=1776032 RepID=A0A3S0JCZ2_9BACT|nr:hypothetical protein [Hymenobacter gummosus]RTQ52532.1 hypothetical protein EJV47_05845 [Hymenobacter gummosus]
MNDLAAKQSSWIGMRQFYQELIEKYHWQQEPMIVLLDQLRQAKFHEKFYASGSHEAVGVSTAAEYLQRLVNNMVYIVYNPAADRFELHYQQGQGNTKRTETCAPKFIASRFEAIESWLRGLDTSGTE